MRTPALALIFLTAANIASAQPTYYARGVAGSPSIGDGGPAKVARVFQPSRVTTDAAGNVYVAEALGRIRKIAVDGTISTFAPRIDGLASGDSGPASEAGISSIVGLTVSGNFLYIAQRSPCNIRRVNLTTNIISNYAGTGACSAGPDGPALTTALNFPGALAADRQGRLYLTEGSIVRRIDPATGRIEAFAGDGTTGYSGDGGHVSQAQFNSPLGLAVDANNNVYISDTGNCRIRKASGANGVLTTVAGTINCGTNGDGGSAVQAQLAGNGEIALDGSGSILYIASSSQTIRKLDLDAGIIDRYAGSGVAGPVQDNVSRLLADLRVILGVHVDAAGNVLFADYGANRVGKISANSLLTTLAGALTYSGDGGPAQYGFLSMPVEVIPESNGRLLISENINRVLRRVSPPGVLSTVAGTGAPGSASGDGGAAIRASVAPGALSRDASGNIYMADALSNTVRRIDVGGAISRVGPVFNSPLGGVAVDPTERFVYVSLTSLHRIARISLSTNLVNIYAGTGALTDEAVAGFAGDGGDPLQAKLNFPQRIFADVDGSLYIADNGNHRIRRINANGDRIDTVAGNGVGDFSGDGNLATQASLPNPIGVTVDASGNILASNASAIFRVDKVSGRMNRIAGKTVRGNSSLGVPALQASFNGIANVSVDANGVIYFAEPLNLRVVALTPSTSKTPVITGIITPGNFGAGGTLTPGGWMEIYGDKLSNLTQSWQNNDFTGVVAPTSLGGVSVTVGGIPAFIQLVSPGQINAVVPDGVIPGNAAIEVTVTRVPGDSVTSDAWTMISAPRAPYMLAPPAFSRGGKQYVTAILPSGAFAGPPDLIPGANFRPAKAGDRLVLYGVGFGATTPVVFAGNIANTLTALPDAKIKIAGVDTQVNYAGLANGFVGLYQFNIQVPSVPSGDQRVEITVDGQPLNQLLYINLE
jgi:uncharacterized protein (TIGR03437 family)